MKVMILNPPRRDGTVMVKEGRCMQRKGAWGYVLSPLTMVTIATMLRDAGHEPVVVDAGVDANDLTLVLDRAREFEPAVVVINTSTPTIEDDLDAARLLKEHAREGLVTVCYGIHVTVLPEDALLPEHRVDYCVLGEPEVTVRELVAALASGGDPGGVRGLAFRPRVGGPVVRTGDRECLGNLDELPVPDWGFVDTGHYRLPFSGERFLLVNTNRGCPFRCTFCNANVYYGRKPRHRSVEHLMRELRSDVERFGVTNFMFWAEEFILDRAYVTAVCEAIIASGLRVRWVCNSRVDAVDGEVLALIRRAGCWNIAYGIESGVPEILEAVRKQTTREQIVRAVTLAKQAGLMVTGHVILGFPEDTPATMRATEGFVDALDLDFVQYYCAIPYPGTELYAAAREHGWLSSTDWTRWEHNCSVLDYPHLGSAEVMETRRRMIRRHYFRPRTVIRTIRKNVRRPRDLLTFLGNVKDFLRWV